MNTSPTARVLAISLAMEHATLQAPEPAVEIIGQQQAWIECYTQVSSECVLESSLEASKQTKGRLGVITWEYDTADVLNGNRRIYPSDIYWPAAEAINGDATGGRLYGELDHPDWYSSDIVSYQNAGIRVLSVEKINATKVRVKGAILKNGHGQTIAACYESGGNCALSHRCFVMWDDPTDEERQRYNLAADTQAVVARTLRLVTFDVVTKPGFQSAWSKGVTESAKEPPMRFTLEQIQKAENAAELIQGLAGAAVAAREAKIPGEIQVAIEAQKAKVIEDATKPLKEQVTKLEGDLKAAKETLETMKGAMVKAGIVVEKADDVKLTGDLRTANEKVATLEKQLADFKAAEATKATETKAKSDADALKIAIEAVKVEHKDNAHLAIIVEAAERGKTADEVKSIATAEAAKIKTLLGNKPAAKPNAKETAASGGGGGTDTQKTQHAATEALLNGLGGLVSQS